MRSAIVDFARARSAERRGGDADHLAIDTFLSGTMAAPENDVLRVHEALHVLEKADPRSAQIVELGYFGGLSDAEIGEATGAGGRCRGRSAISRPGIGRGQVLDGHHRAGRVANMAPAMRAQRGRGGRERLPPPRRGPRLHAGTLFGPRYADVHCDPRLYPVVARAGRRRSPYGTPGRRAVIGREVNIRIPSVWMVLECLLDGSP